MVGEVGHYATRGMSVRTRVLDLLFQGGCLHVGLAARAAACWPGRLKSSRPPALAYRPNAAPARHPRRGGGTGSGSCRYRSERAKVDAVVAEINARRWVIRGRAAQSGRGGRTCDRLPCSGLNQAVTGEIIRASGGIT